MQVNREIGLDHLLVVLRRNSITNNNSSNRNFLVCGNWRAHKIRIQGCGTRNKPCANHPSICVHFHCIRTDHNRLFICTIALAEIGGEEIVHGVGYLVMKLRPWFMPPLLVVYSLAKVNFKIASFTSICVAHHHILCTCSWKGTRDVPSKWRVCIGSKVSHNTGKLSARIWVSLTRCNTPTREAPYCSHAESIHFSLYTHTLSYPQSKHFPYQDGQSQASIIIRITPISYMYVCKCVRVCVHVVSKRNIIGMTTNLWAKRRAATDWEGQKSSECAELFYWSSGRVIQQHSSSSSAQHPLKGNGQKWDSGFLPFFSSSCFFLSLHFAIPSLLLPLFSAMKNASWGSALVNGVGLISNLMALYAANFVYENPYATGFGGHFQVGGGLAVYKCGMKTISSSILDTFFTYHYYCCCIVFDNPWPYNSYTRMCCKVGTLLCPWCNGR